MSEKKTEKTPRNALVTDVAHYAALSRRIAGLLDEVTALEAERALVRARLELPEVPPIIPERLLAKPASRSKAVLEVARVIYELGGAATNKQIAAKLGIGPMVVALRVSRGVKLGILVRVKQGLYKIADPDVSQG